MTWGASILSALAYASYGFGLFIAFIIAIATGSALGSNDDKGFWIMIAIALVYGFFFLTITFKYGWV